MLSRIRQLLDKPKWLKLVEALVHINEQKKTGPLRVDFRDGGVSSISFEEKIA